MKLLVAVAGDPLARAIREALLTAHHEVALAGTGSIVVAMVAEEPLDAVILDESLFGASTNRLIASMRQARPSIKILLLISTPLSKTTGEGSRWRALPDEYEPIEDAASGSSGLGFASGSESGSEAKSESDSTAEDGPKVTNQPDIVLRKPFSDGELLSYVETFAANSPTMIIHGNLTLDLTNKKAYYASTHNAISLSRLEYGLLEVLAKADGEFVDTAELQKLVGGPFFEQGGLLKNALYTLDRKLTRSGLILTQRGAKYRIR